MQQYNVGDEVLVKGKITEVGTASLTLSIKFHNRWDLWLAPEDIHSTLAFASGWNPVSVLPNLNLGSGKSPVRNFCLKRANGEEGYGWWLGGGVWGWFGTEYDPKFQDSMYGSGSPHITDVIAWKELEDVTPTATLAGWNPLSTLQNIPEREVTLNVQVIREDGTTGYAWRGRTGWWFRETYHPNLHDPNWCDINEHRLHSDESPIVGWKELEPLPPTKLESKPEPVKPQPSVPDGWTPANQPPAETDTLFSGRNVRVLLDDRRQVYAWYECEINGWYFVGDTFNPAMLRDMYSGECTRLNNVIAWREIGFSLAIGDKVISLTEPKRGIGTIIEYDYDDLSAPYKINYPAVDDWFWGSDLTVQKVNL